MSTLIIIVGVWLVLNTVVFAALMLNDGRRRPVSCQETLEKPSLLPPEETERDDLLARARRADTASHLDGWAKSRELQPPE
jgi:hypothetical protein